MPALAQRAGTENQSINYDFGQKTREEPAPGVRIHISNVLILNVKVLLISNILQQDV